VQDYIRANFLLKRIRTAGHPFSHAISSIYFGAHDAY
jgi:hypothetical protein